MSGAVGEAVSRTGGAPERFPAVFWTANVTELFERCAYYSMASFVVIYLGQLGMGKYWPSNLNSILWTIVYFLPIISGTIADQVGFRKSLLVAFVLLAAGYLLMGYPVWFGGETLSPVVRPEFTASPGLVGLVVVAILLIGVGGSVVKPCISGTVQKTSGALATLGFAIFYMIINIGSLFGRGTAYVVRTRSSVVPVLATVAICAVAATLLTLLVRWSVSHRSEKGTVARTSLGSLLIVVLAGAGISGVLRLGSGPAADAAAAAAKGSSLSYIFAVAAVASAVAFVVVLLFYKEPEVPADAPVKPKRSVGRILLDMVLVLKNLRFALFLLVSQAAIRRLRVNWSADGGGSAGAPPRWVSTFAASEFWRAACRWDRGSALDRNPVAWLQEYSWTARLTKWGWLCVLLGAEFTKVWAGMKGSPEARAAIEAGPIDIGRRRRKTDRKIDTGPVVGAAGTRTGPGKPRPRRRPPAGAPRTGAHSAGARR